MTEWKNPAMWTTSGQVSASELNKPLRDHWTDKMGIKSTSTLTRVITADIAASLYDEIAAGEWDIYLQDLIKIAQIRQSKYRD